MKSSFCSSALAKREAVAAGEIFSPAGRASRKNSAAATDSPILELGGIKVTLHGIPTATEDDIRPSGLDSLKQFQRCISVRCKSWMCPDCRPGKGIEVRRRLMQKATEFVCPRLYTITVNRDWFASPAEAYRYVMEKKFISRLLTKELKIRRWVWVLEAQEENGDGWPHWHILIDVGELPGVWYCRENKEYCLSRPDDQRRWLYIPHFLDLNRVHRLLRKWHIGEQCYLSVKQRKFQSPVHAIRYITKYLVKMPRRGFPDWMLHYSGLRFYQPSRALGTLDAGNVRRVVNPPEAPQQRTMREPVERIAECRCNVVFVHYDPNLDKMVCSPVIAGEKESIKLFPGAVEIKDFDFERRREFSVWGFERTEDVRYFNEAWCSPLFHRRLEEKIEQRKTMLLAQWSASA